jgi:hypothetical protein
MKIAAQDFAHCSCHEMTETAETAEAAEMTETAEMTNTTPAQGQTMMDSFGGSAPIFGCITTPDGVMVFPLPGHEEEVYRRYYGKDGQPRVGLGGGGLGGVGLGGGIGGESRVLRAVNQIGQLVRTANQIMHLLGDPEQARSILGKSQRAAQTGVLPDEEEPLSLLDQLASLDRSRMIDPWANTYGFNPLRMLESEPEELDAYGIEDAPRFFYDRLRSFTPVMERDLFSSFEPMSVAEILSRKVEPDRLTVPGSLFDLYLALGI